MQSAAEPAVPISGQPFMGDRRTVTPTRYEL